MATTRLDNILRKARHTLTDSQGDRYDNALLLDHLDTAQKQIAFDATLLSTTVSGTIVDGTDLYDWPADAALFLRLSIGGAKVVKSDFAAMDSLGTWELATSALVSKVLLDKVIPYQFQLYPIPTNPTVTTYTLRYSRIPATITRLTDAIEIPLIFDLVLVDYIIFLALHSDQDTANRTKAAEYLTLYGAKMAQLRSATSVSFTDGSNLSTTYLSGDQA